jgi:hypothetical protein
VSTQFDERIDICADKGVTAVTAEETCKTQRKEKKIILDLLISVQLPARRHKFFDEGVRAGSGAGPTVTFLLLLPPLSALNSVWRVKRELASDIPNIEAYYSFQKTL